VPLLVPRLQVAQGVGQQHCRCFDAQHRTLFGSLIGKSRQITVPLLVPTTRSQVAQMVWLIEPIDNSHTEQ
jgi:hypothetical protein